MIQFLVKSIRTVVVKHLDDILLLPVATLTLTNNVLQCLSTYKIR